MKRPFGPQARRRVQIYIFAYLYLASRIYVCTSLEYVSEYVSCLSCPCLFTVLRGEGASRLPGAARGSNMYPASRARIFSWSCAVKGPLGSQAREPRAGSKTPRRADRGPRRPCPVRDERYGTREAIQDKIRKYHQDDIFDRSNASGSGPQPPLPGRPCRAAQARPPAGRPGASGTGAGGPGRAGEATKRARRVGDTELERL